MRNGSGTTPLFFVTSRDDERSSILWVVGELDAHTVAAFEAELERLVPKCRSLIVELSSCSFVSAAALGSLVRFRGHLPGGAVALVTESSHVAKVLRIAGLERQFPLFNDLVEALAAVAETSARTDTLTRRRGRGIVHRLPARSASLSELGLVLEG